MRCVNFPNACNIDVIVGLGGTPVAIAGGQRKDKRLFIREVEAFIDEKKRFGYSFLTVSLNSEQKKEKKWLKELGFQFTPWAYKCKHPETQVCIGWKSLFTKQEVDDLIDEYGEGELCDMAEDGHIPA